MAASLTTIRLYVALRTLACALGQISLSNRQLKIGAVASCILIRLVPLVGPADGRFLLSCCLGYLRRSDRLSETALSAS